jgi:predicted DNA-binding protein
MPTKNPRISLTLEAPTAGLLSTLAEREEKSVSYLVKELIMEAMERREDKALSIVAEQRDKRRAKRIKHHNAWK